MPEHRRGGIFSGTSGVALRERGPATWDGRPKVPFPPRREMGSPRGQRSVQRPERASPVVSSTQGGTTFAQNATDRTSHESNHHLWQNGRLWWIAFTVHRPDWTKHRIRLSLKTDDVVEARRRRDRILAAFGRRTDCNLAVRLPEDRRAG